MTKFFDEQKWRKAVHHPDWYLRIQDDYQALMKQTDEVDEETKAEIKEEVYAFFEELLGRGEVYLSDTGYDFDADRQPVDTVVLHHTSGEPGMRLSRLNTMHLLRLYVPNYANPALEQEKHLQGQPIYSGHFDDGEQVFYAYHWLVRNDGTVEHLLRDEKIGWQAGDWDMNCRSVAICFDDDLGEKKPTKKALESAADIINSRYKGLGVLGHREVNSKTECPGGLFLPEWKQDLKERLV